MRHRVTKVHIAKIFCSFTSIIETAENDYLIAPDCRPVPTPRRRRITFALGRYICPSGILQFETPEIIEMVELTLRSRCEFAAEYTE
jgi:hypothetical protein